MSENPSLNGNPSGLETPSAVGQIGRPPDFAIQLSCPLPLERCRDPGVPEYEPVDKRARDREEVLDTNMMEVEEGQKEEASVEVGTDLTSGKAVGRENDRGPVDNLTGKESYASMVARNSGSGTVQDGVCDAGSVEIKVSENDYVIDRSGPFPTVEFSDKDVSGNKDRASTSHGSRFATLVVEDVMTPTDENVEPSNAVGALNTESTTPKLTAGRVSKSIVQRPTVVKNAAYKASNPDKKGGKRSELNVGLPVNPICIDQEVEVVHHPVAHHSNNHTVVSLVDKYPGSSEAIGGKMQRVRGAAGRALNSSVRRGVNIKKPAGVRSLSQSPLSEWAVNFSKQLAASGDTVGGHVPIQPMNGLSEAPGDGLLQSPVRVEDVGTGSALEERTDVETSSASIL
ncbi:hypothetical protein V6N11_032731 [Hibiscus sabdariffa]|uniref:Uncharacterized protein n=1 Tax=Hibiscus sabdariffa TaxID=183260 RepID=A0ABR2T1I2_9ROSI